MSHRSQRRPLLAALAAFASACGWPAAHAQDYPSKPIRLVVEYPAGAGGDAFLRRLAQAMGKDLGQAVVVENRAGASGVVAAEAVARAAPDGYTVLAASSNPLVIRPFIAKAQTVDVFRDLAPVSLVYNATSIILAHKSLPVASMAEFITYAKANPGKVFYATSGQGSVYHFIGEALQQMTGIKLVHVPYKGGTGSTQAVMTGEVPVAIGFGASALPAINSGNVRVLAVLEGKRFMNLNAPDVSQLVRGFEAPPSWTGLFMPAHTPPALVRRISASAARAMKEPDFPNFDGIEPVGNAPEQFTAQLKAQFELVGRLAKAANIQPE